MLSSIAVSWAAIVLIGVVLTVLMTIACLILPNFPLRAERGQDERMTPLEMGIDLVPRQSPRARAAISLAIFFIGPLGAHIAARLTIHATAIGVGQQIAVWGMAFLLSIAAIGGAMSLAPDLTGSDDRAEPLSSAKPPAFDSESFEVPSRHG